MKNVFKKIMAMALIIAMIVGVLPSVFAANVAGFTDVQDDAWYAKYVEYVAFQDLMTGTSPTTFEPDSGLTRAMTATVLWRMAGEPPVYNKSTFTDLKSDWYMNAVAWAQAKDIVNGTSATTFEPDAFATREQIVAMLWRYSGSPKVETDHLKDYTDASRISGYARDAFNWAVSVGILSGYKNRLTPRDNATRAEFAKMIYQYAELNKPCTHEWDEGKVTKEPTCTEAGEKLLTCTKCGLTKTEPIPAKGHHYGDDGKCTDCGAEKPVDPTEPTTPPTPSGDEYVLTNELKDGDKVIIVCAAKKTALSGEYKGFYNLGVEVAPVDGKITTDNTAIVWTVGKNGDKYTFSYNGKKIGLQESYSSMPLEAKYTDWTISDATAENTHYVYNGDRGVYMEYQESFGTWSAYKDNSKDTELFELSFYVKGGKTPEPTEPTEPTEPPTPPTPAAEEYVKTTTLKEGDEVIIVCGAKDMALSAEYSGNYNKGVPVTPVDDKITTDNKTIVWTVGREGDFYTFSYNGKKLAMGTEYTSMPLDAVNYKWQVEAAKTAGAFYIKNLDRDSTKAYYIQWYADKNSWSAYHTLNEELMALSFYVKGGETPEPCEHVWGEGVETTPATCTEAGVKTYTCSKCGLTKTEPIPALGHDYVDGVCSRCGAAKPAGGVYTEVTTAQEDWSGTYVIVYKKDELNAYVFNGLDESGNYVTAPFVGTTIAATEGVKACEVVVEKFGNGYSFQLTGGDNDGKYLAAYDGRNKIVFQDTAKALAITVENGAAVIKDGDAPFQFNNGASNGMWFRFFGKKPGGQQPTALYKLSDGGETPHVHTWNDGVITTEPTCTEAGVKTYTCTDCGETKTEAVDALGHNYVDGVCSRCGVAEPTLTEYIKTTTLKEGDEIIIVCGAKNIALSSEKANTNYNKGVTVTPVDNKITTGDKTIVWTVGKEGEFYTFSQDGHKISMGTKYTSMPMDDVNYKWQVTAAETEGAFYIGNLGRGESETDAAKKVYYMQWYESNNYWSAYHKLNEELMALNFYVKKTAEEPAKDITVYFTNDVHGAYELYPYAAAAMKGADLIVDAGDNIQGSVATTLTNGQCMVDLMKAVGYDVAVPGNHEFDYGFDRFLEIVNGDNTPYVSANLWDKTADKAVLDAYKMFTVNGKKVAIVGITTPETLVKSTPTFFQNDKGEYIYDFCNDTTGEKLYKVVQQAVDAAKAAGADYIIAVGHLGIDEQSEPWTSTSVIANTTGIDALIDGHSHSTFSNTQKNKDGKDIVVAQTGTKLANVGKLTIAADGTITAVNIPLYEVKTRVNPDTGKEEKYNDYLFEEDEKIAAEVAKVKEEVDKVSEKVVAKTEVDLTTLDPVTGKRAVRNAETNLGDLCADAYRDLLGTDIAFVNGGGVRADIKKGDITYGQIIAVHPFGNTACKIEVTGEQIWTALEIGAAAMPGESGGFLQVSGLEYTINTYIPTPARFDENKNFVKLEGEHRVTDVKIGGQPLDVNKTYTLGGHNYMLINGGDGFTVFKGSKILAQEVAIDNEVLIKYITGTLNGVVAADSVYANPTGAGRITIVTEKPEEPDTHTHTYCAPEDATYTWDDIHTTCTATTLCTDKNCPDPEKGKITETCNDVTKKVIFRWTCLEEELSDVTATFKDTEHFLSTVKLEKAVTKKVTATEHTWDENDECTVCHIFAGLNSKQLALLHPASGMLLLDQTYNYEDGKTGLQGAEYAIEDGVVNTLEKEYFKFRIDCDTYYERPYELVIARGTFYCDGKNLTVKEKADIDETLWKNIYFDIETNADGTKYISFTNVTNENGEKLYLKWDGEAFTVAPMDENNKAAYTFKLAVGGHAHKKVNPTVTTPATCTTDGVRTYECESKVSGCTKTWQETIPATGHDVDTATGVCKTCGKTVYALAEGVRAGDEVIIYHVDSGKAMSTEKFAGVGVTPVKDTVTTDAAIVWKVEKDVNGLKFVNAATGEILATDSSKALKYAETDNYWTLEWSKDFKSRIIVNTTAKGNQGDPQAIEWFKGSFTTYYWKTTSTESDFAVQFYVKDIQAAEHEHVYSDVTTRWESDYSAFYFESHCTVPGCGTGSDSKITGTGITETVKKEATCTAEGKVQYSVTYNANGTSLTAISPEVTVPAKGHDYDPTTHRCTRCGEPEPLTPPVSSTRYEKVTSSLEDYSGTYLIVYENSTTEGYVFNGTDAAKDYAVAEIVDGKTISGNETINALTVTIEKAEGGYNIKVNGGENAGKYMYGTSGNNKINFGTASLNTISIADGGDATITSNTSVMRFNKGGNRFRYHKSTTSGADYPLVTLYKLVTE